MWPYLLSLLLPAMAIGFISIDRPELFLLAVLCVIPIADALIGKSKSTITKCDDKSAEFIITFHIPHVYQTLWLVVLGVAGYKAISAPQTEFVFIVLCCCLMAALFSTAGHEFMHRDCEHSRLAADLAFSIIGYGHYTISHHIHHVKAGLEHFGSAPDLGESVWRYFPASLRNGFLAAWRSEYRKHAYNPFLNKVIRQWLLTAVIASLFFVVLGVRGLVLFGAQAAFAIFFIELAGYVQHYGLRHVENTPYTQDLAWDANYWLSNHLLLNNPLHAHHHRDPRVVCMHLEPVAPTLPAGYFSIIWAAMIPSLWYALMDKRVIALRSKKDRYE